MNVFLQNYFRLDKIFPLEKRLASFTAYRYPAQKL